MKRVLGILLCLALLGSGALAAELSFEPQTVLMPALYLQMSVPAGIEPEYAQNKESLAWLMEMDLGMRYEGQNDDLSISVWMYNHLDAEDSAEVAKSFEETALRYQVTETALNGYSAYRLYREAESNSVGYLLTDETELTGPSVAYTIFITAYTERGAALRDEILSTLQPITIE